MAEPEAAIKLIYKKYAPQLSEDFLRFEAKAMAELLRTDLIEVGYMNPHRHHLRHAGPIAARY